MRIGILKEIMTFQGCVALVINAVSNLIKAGHESHMTSQASLRIVCNGDDFEQCVAALQKGVHVKSRQMTHSAL